MKRFTCDAGTFDIDQVMNGQTPLSYYDALAQIASKPDLRMGTILCYNATGVEGLFSQLGSLYKSEVRTVKTNPYYWTEKCEDTNITATFIGKVAASSPGGTVTVTLDKSAHTRGGQFSTAMAGRRGYIKQLQNQGVNIVSVDRSTNGAHTMVLQGLNGQVLDLSKFAYYQILIDPLRMYKKGDMECIKTEGFTAEQPLIRMGYIQGFEKGYSIHQDELNGYAYEREFQLGVGMDQMTGKIIDYWDIPEISNKLLVDWMDSRNINTLFGVRDDVKGTGFDGIITTADAQGMFSNYYDPNDGVSFKTKIFNMIKSVRKVNGCSDYILAYDFNFRMDWTEQIAALVIETKSDHVYKLFGEGGEGARNFTWYEFKDFEAFGYYFRGFQVDAFDSQRYGGVLEDFAFLLPACNFKDNLGRTVPPVAFVNIERAEKAPVKHMKTDDTRERGCRVLNVYLEDYYGFEIHCATKMGTWRKYTC